MLFVLNKKLGRKGLLLDFNVFINSFIYLFSFTVDFTEVLVLYLTAPINL